MTNRNKTPADYRKEYGLNSARKVPILSQDDLEKAWELRRAWIKLRHDIFKSSGKS